MVCFMDYTFEKQSIHMITLFQEVLVESKIEQAWKGAATSASNTKGNICDLMEIVD